MEDAQRRGLLQHRIHSWVVNSWVPESAPGDWSNTDSAADNDGSFRSSGNGSPAGSPFPAPANIPHPIGRVAKDNPPGSPVGQRPVRRPQSTVPPAVSAGNRGWIRKNPASPPPRNGGRGCPPSSGTEPPPGKAPKWPPPSVPAKTDCSGANSTRATPCAARTPPVIARILTPADKRNTVSSPKFAFDSVLMFAPDPPSFLQEEPCQEPSGGKQGLAPDGEKATRRTRRCLKIDRNQIVPPPWERRTMRMISCPRQPSPYRMGPVPVSVPA